MSYAEQLPDIVAEYKKEIREQEEAYRRKWQAFVENLQKKGAEHAGIPTRS